MNPGSIAHRLSWTATILAGTASAAGLLITDLYRDAPNWVQQARGTDLATLFIAVPVLVLGLWGASRGVALGRVAVVAGLLYLTYNYAIFAFSVAMNPLTAVHLAILGLAIWSLVLDAQSPTVITAGRALSARLYRRATGWLLIAVGVLFAMLWLGQIAETTMTGALPPDLALAGMSTNPVYALDLAFFLPLCAVAGIGLLRQNQAAAYGLTMLLWVPMMGAGVLGGFVFIAAAGDPVPMVVVGVIGALIMISSLLAAAPLMRLVAPGRSLDTAEASR